MISMPPATCSAIRPLPRSRIVLHRRFPQNGWLNSKRLPGALWQRFRYSFIRTYKPVLDDGTYRSFETTADYRRWCEG